MFVDDDDVSVDDYDYHEVGDDVEKDVVDEGK